MLQGGEFGETSLIRKVSLIILPRNWKRADIQNELSTWSPCRQVREKNSQPSNPKGRVRRNFSLFVLSGRHLFVGNPVKSDTSENGTSVAIIKGEQRLLTIPS